MFPRIMVFEDDKSIQLMVRKQVNKLIPQAKLEILDQVFTAAPEIASFMPHAVIMDFHFDKGQTSESIIPFLCKLKIETFFYTSDPEQVERACIGYFGKIPKNIHVYSKQDERPSVFREIKKYVGKLTCTK